MAGFAHPRRPAAGQLPSRKRGAGRDWLGARGGVELRGKGRKGMPPSLATPLPLRLAPPPGSFKNAETRDRTGDLQNFSLTRSRPLQTQVEKHPREFVGSGRHLAGNGRRVSTSRRKHTHMYTHRRANTDLHSSLHVYPGHVNAHALIPRSAEPASASLPSCISWESA